MSLSTGEISIENGRSLEDFNAADCADPMLVEKRQARNIAFLIMVIVPLRCDLLAEESGDRRAYPIFVVRSFVEKTGERSVCPHVMKKAGTDGRYPIFAVRSFVEKAGERPVCPHVIPSPCYSIMDVPMLFPCY